MHKLQNYISENSDWKTIRSQYFENPEFPIELQFCSYLRILSPLSTVFFLGKWCKGGNYSKVFQSYMYEQLFCLYFNFQRSSICWHTCLHPVTSWTGPQLYTGKWDPPFLHPRASRPYPPQTGLCCLEQSNTY